MPQSLIRFAASSMLAVLVFTSSNFATITGTEKGWQPLNTAIAGDTDDRSTAVAVLAPTPNDPQAFHLATEALDDLKPSVRIAAFATPLRDLCSSSFFQVPGTRY